MSRDPTRFALILTTLSCLAFATPLHGQEQDCPPREDPGDALSKPHKLYVAEYPIIRWAIQFPPPEGPNIYTQAPAFFKKESDPPLSTGQFYANAMPGNVENKDFVWVYDIDVNNHFRRRECWRMSQWVTSQINGAKEDVSKTIRDVLNDKSIDEMNKAAITAAKNQVLEELIAQGAINANASTEEAIAKFTSTVAAEATKQVLKTLKDQGVIK